MRLGSARRLLSIIMSAVIAFSVVGVIFSFVYTQTLGKPEYIKNRIVKSDIASQCQTQLEAKYAVLADESGIPLRVYTAIEEDYGISNSLSQAVDNIFGAEDTSLYSNNLIDYFYDLLVEYLEADGIDYDKDDIRYTAERAARIYSDTVGIHSVSTARYKLEALSKSARSAALICVVLIVISGLGLAFLFTDKKKMLLYFFGGISAGGLAALLSSAAMLIFGVTRRITLEPQIYMSVLQKTQSMYILFALLMGMAALIVGFVASLAINKSMNKNSPRGIAV
jgi:hypothetical protein